MASLIYPLFRPRHLAASLVVALFVGTSTAGVVLLATAGDTWAPAPVQDAFDGRVRAPFGVAAIHDGDRGRYEAEYSVSPLPEGQTGRSVAGGVEGIPSWESVYPAVRAFAFQDVGVRYDAQGDPLVSARLLMEEHRGPSVEYPVYWVAHADPFAFAREFHQNQAGPAEESEGTLPGTTINRTSVHQATYTDFHRGDGPGHWLPCGLIHPFQGRSVPLGETSMKDEGYCWGGPNPLSGGVHTLRVRQDTVVDGIRHVALEHTYEGRTTTGLQASWFREDLPYPYRMEFSDVFGDKRVHIVYDLVGFQRGHTPWTAASATALAPLGPLDGHPRTPWGPEDTGIDHPFPLSAAYQYALEDPEYPDLRRFLDEHPDAYMGWARHARFLNEDRISDRWMFRVTTGAHHLDVGVIRDERGSHLEGIPLPVGPREVSYRYQDGASPLYGRSVLPAPQHVPDTLPRVADLLERWRAYAGPGAPEPLSWGFQVSCWERDLDGPCTEPQVFLEAGRVMHEREESGVPLLLQQWKDTWRSFVLHMENGEATRYSLSVQESYSRQGAVFPPDATDGPQQGPMGNEAPGQNSPAIQVPASTWLTPTPAQAAGLAGAGLAAGLVYWLWPLLKSIPAALFTRLHRDRLLDHPARRRIMAAVEADPGIHFQELVRRVDGGQGTVSHHLQKLEAGGLVTATQGSGYTCYFPGRGTDRRVLAAAPALRSEGARRILHGALAKPGVTPTDLARDVGLSPQTVHYHLHRLEEAGLVATRRDGRAVRVHATDTASLATRPVA